MANKTTLPTVPDSQPVMVLGAYNDDVEIIDIANDATT